MRAVVDASVALKWFLGARSGERDVELASSLLRAVAAGAVVMVQPPHFLVEMAAVLIRETPATAHRDLADLMQLDMQIDAPPGVYSMAMSLAERYKQHLFDTLYHALALVTDGAVCGSLLTSATNAAPGLRGGCFCCAIGGCRLERAGPAAHLSSGTCPGSAGHG